MPFPPSGGVSQLVAGTDISLSPTDGRGTVTINGSGGGGLTQIGVTSGSGDTGATNIASTDLGNMRQAVDALTYTIPANLQAYASGSAYFGLVQNMSTGYVTITGASGVTVNGVNQGSFSIGPNQTASYIQPLATNAWVVTSSDALAPGNLAVDNVSSGGIAASVSTLGWTHNYGFGANGIVFVGVLQIDASNLVTGVTYGGVSMSSCGTPLNIESGGQWLMMYYLLAPPSGPSTVTISTSGNVTDLGGAAISYSGARQSSQPDAYNTANNAGTSGLLAGSVTPATANSWVMAIYRATTAFNATSVTTANLRLGPVANNGFLIFDTNCGVPAAATALQGNATTASQSQGMVLVSIAP